MTDKLTNRPAFRPLNRLLPQKEAGEAELQHIVMTLLRVDARRKNPAAESVRSLSISSGMWLVGTTLYVCQLSSGSKRDYGSLLNRFDELYKTLARDKRPTDVVVIAPDASSRSSRDFVDFLVETLPNRFQSNRRQRQLRLTLWDDAVLTEKLLAIPSLGLRYYPELLPRGRQRRQTINRTRQHYDQEFAKLYSKIQFVGMSVYKEEASSSVDIEDIYIPLRIISEGAVENDHQTTRTDPLDLLAPGGCHVILGDPGSGKSTLLRFLGLAGNQPKLIERFGAQQDERLPILVTLRQYADELKGRSDLTLVDYIRELTQSDLALWEADPEFFAYYLYAGKAILLLDGLDELASSDFKTTVRDRVAEFLQDYPGNTTILTSRIVGYDEEVRYDSLGFSHHLVARLSLPDIEDFVTNWYRARLANDAELQRHSEDLIRIFRDPDNRSIRDLAENPLLLTIICLVHRIDAVLPDERVVLYQKCTETLLNTWHTWKFHSEQQRSRNKVERRNRARMEAIAYWMHCLLDEEGETQRAVVPYEDLRDFLAEYITDIEKSRDNPEELAETFLRFIKERAGLLVEAGDGLYSFLHLTFQEYLSATYLRKSGETAGIGIIWEFIEGRCVDSRWHEVIRLLVGSLERTESQAFLLERIVSGEAGLDDAPRALLAGGCLLDSIDAAEEMHEEILKRLLI